MGRNPAEAVRQLVEQLEHEQQENEALRLLDAAADITVAAGLSHRLAPLAARLSDFDYSAHPWAALPASVAICSVDRRRGRSILATARMAFATAGDRYGEGLGCSLEGLEDLIEGKLDEANGWWACSRELLEPDHVIHRLMLAHRSLVAYEKGDLTVATALAEEAIWSAEHNHDPRAEALAAVYLGFFSIYTGRFDECRAALARARSAFEHIDIDNRYEEPLLHTGEAILLSLQGEHQQSLNAFDTALHRARAVDNHWYEAIALTARAEFTAATRPVDAAQDAKLALRYLDQMDAHWWSRWARLTLAIAHLHCGNADAGLRACEHVLGSGGNAVERGRALVVQAELLELQGRPCQSVLEEAESLLDASGASFWAARASIVLAATDSRHTEYHRRRANQRAPKKRCDEWDRLLEGRGPLGLDLRGAGSLTVNSANVHLPTKMAIEALAMLALTGSSGMRRGTIGDRLWPDDDPDRVSHRLDTLFSGLRHQLLPTLRMSRQGGMVRLRLRPGECAVSDALCLADRLLMGDPVDGREVRAAVEILRRPVLDQIDAPWIDLENARLARIGERLGEEA